MGYLDVVTTLIAKGADVNKVNTNGSTPLYRAAVKGHKVIVSKLLEHGADKSIRGFQNKTPLEAVKGRRIVNRAAIIKLLES